ncbi:MAG: sodium-dependent transporter [Opitutaceae bacterium]|nr:sodium-dependent transporter [Opitutaceae bacterium]
MTLRTPEAWTGRFGAILAVAGSAVGLGNFIRFPAQAAQYGGGAFMLAYFASFLIIGIPLVWAEWTLGRMGGKHGYHSAAGVLHSVVHRPWAKYLGGLGFLIVTLIFVYYISIEAWCLGYTVNALLGRFDGSTDYGAFFGTFVGAGANGSAIAFGLGDLGLFLLATFALNFYFIHRGISRGIETVCRYALPALLALALVILARVLTLGTPDPTKPDQNVINGLGFLWNPSKPGLSVFDDLANPQLWLAAASQVFFSLSIGMGVIITYASYLKPRDDVALSGLTAAAANEACEVGIGGTLTVPAAYVFLGASGVAALAGQTIGLGFIALPQVLANMPGGQALAVCYFGLLFLAALTSSLSMLQPGIALLEEGPGFDRGRSVGLLALLTALGAAFVWYFSADLKALDTIDFWVANVLIFIQATAVIIVFGWVIGIKQGLAETRRGAKMHVPDFVGPVMKYLCPAYLLAIFGLFVVNKIVGWNFRFGADAAFSPSGYVTDLVGPEPSAVARASFALIVAFLIFTLLLVRHSARRWQARANLTPAPSPLNPSSR